MEIIRIHPQWAPSCFFFFFFLGFEFVLRRRLLRDRVPETRAAAGVYKVKPSDDIRFDYMRLIGVGGGEDEKKKEEEDPLTRSLSGAPAVLFVGLVNF